LWTVSTTRTPYSQLSASRDSHLAHRGSRYPLWGRGRVVDQNGTRAPSSLCPPKAWSTTPIAQAGHPQPTIRLPQSAPTKFGINGLLLMLRAVFRAPRACLRAFLCYDLYVSREQNLLFSLVWIPCGCFWLGLRLSRVSVHG